MSHMYNSGDFAPPYQMKSPSMGLVQRHSMSAPMSGISTSLNLTQNKYNNNDKQSSLLVNTSGGKSPNYSNLNLNPTTWTAADEEYNKPRRIWVKMPQGTPTTILAYRDDIIDDLKSQIIQKYPNSIGRFEDAANLSLKLDKLNSPSTENVLETQPNGPINEARLLEPDRNVWQVLNTYFPQGMGMKDAILIESFGHSNAKEAAPKGSHHRHSYSDQGGHFAKPTSHIKQPQPRQAEFTRPTPAVQQQQQQQQVKNFPAPKSSYAGAHYKDRSVSPSLTAAKNSPIPRNQSHANVVQSPLQKSNPQAILLLPKNFSINSSSSKSKIQENTDTTEDATQAKSEVTSPQEHPAVKDKKVDSDFVSSPSPAPSTEQSSKSDVLPSLTKTIASRKNAKSDTKSDPALDKVFPSISVLVVEDNAINQAILGAFLRKRKINYQIAKNGQEAIDKWKKGGFHLVLMDIQLPVKSGIEATKEIRHLEKLNKIGVFDDTELSKLALNELQPDDKLDANTFRSPVIIVALTASSNSSVDRKNALTAGCNDYLTKPVNLVWLQNKITEWGCMQALIDFEGWKGKKNWATA